MPSHCRPSHLSERRLCASNEEVPEHVSPSKLFAGGVASALGWQEGQKLHFFFFAFWGSLIKASVAGVPAEGEREKYEDNDMK